MSKLILKSEAIMEIINREIPKLFSDEGNLKYRTNDVEFCFLDENGCEVYLNDWHIEISETARDAR